MSGYWKDKEFSDNHRKKLSESHKGNVGYWRGKKKTKEHVKKSGKTLSENYKTGKLKPNKTAFKKGRIPWNKDLKTRLVPKSAFKKGNKGYWTGKERTHMKGDKHPMWQNGISFGNYSVEFTAYKKNKIRKRDNYTCQKCSKKEKDEYSGKMKTKLSTHHIDYDKQNCKDKNLITLCRKCNSEVNKDRTYWENYFNILVLKI